MIDAAGRGAVPIQLAAAELGRSLAAARAERPLAIALEVIGMHLARGERLSTPEVRQLVALMDATLDVFSAAAPPAAPTQVVLKAAHVAIREFQRDATQMLAQHQQLSATLLPILDRLIVAVAANDAEGAPTLDRSPATEHGASPSNDVPLTTHTTAEPNTTLAVASAPPPSLAKLLASVIEAIAHLQPLLTAEPTLVRTLSNTITQLRELPPSVTTAAPLPHAIAHLEELVVLLTQSSVAAPPAEVAKAIAQVIEELTQAVTPPAAQSTPSAPNTPSAPTASPTEVFSAAPNSPLTPNPAGAPTIQIVVAQIIASLQAAIVSTGRTPALPASALLTPTALQAEMPFSGLLPPPPARLENLDAYRWAMLAALSAWQAPHRPLSGRGGPSARRCGMCGRLLEPTRIEALLCPTCQLYQQS
jgi:hypothetical protein